MKRLAFAMVGVGVILVGLIPGARGDVSGAYLDSFRAVSYSGSDGNLDWRGPWLEVGESDGPDAGAVRVDSHPGCVTGNCLVVVGDLLQVGGASRFADTSVFGDAHLSYHVESALLAGGGLIGGVSGSSLLVEVSTDSGASWVPIDLLLLADLDGSGTKRTVPLGGYLAEGFGLRFSVQDLLEGRVMIDDVMVSGPLRPPPTTTTSSTTTTPTTTTIDRHTTTTTQAGSTTTTPRTTTSVPDPRDGSTTTTSAGASGPGTTDPADPTLDSRTNGLRMGGGGIMADYGSGLRVLPIDLAADYRSSAETIASRSIGLAGLTLVVTGASILGVDRRRRLTASGQDGTGVTGET